MDSLIYIEREPVRAMESQVSTLQSKVSAYQSLNTKLSALSDKVNLLLYGDTAAPLAQKYSFRDRLADSVFAKCGITSSNEDKISATADNPTAEGSYAITVSQLAQAQTTASAGFAATSTTTGTGTIVITAGTNAPVTVTITSSNNTLTGVRNAINNANAGVTATIVNDGSSTAPYRLLITSNDTGEANAFIIEDTLSGGTALGFGSVPTQAAQNAEFIVNGVGISNSSNTISNVIDGVTFTLKEATTSAVTLRVEKDVDTIVTTFKDLVTAYNAVNTYIGSQFTYNKTAESAGVLAGDSTLRRIQSNLQNQIVQSVSNSFTTSYNLASQVGVEFNRDGSLTLNETELRQALSEDFTSVAAIFLGDGTTPGGATATDSRVTYNGKTSATEAGTYDIGIGTLAEQASAVGTEVVGTLLAAETLSITYGGSSYAVSLDAGANLGAILDAINAEVTLQGVAITATDDGTGRIKISTDAYGSSQTISVTSTGSGGSGTTGFSAAAISDTGVDIAGTIGGNAAVGSGRTLTGASGLPEEGLSVIIDQTTTGSYGSITVAPGGTGIEGDSVLMNLFSLLDGLTDPLSGPIYSARDGLNRSIDSIEDRITEYEARLEGRKKVLTAQFNAADEALKLLTVSQSSLSSQLASLK